VADLTVLEHLKLTASFLGLNPIDAAQQIDLLTEALNLSLKLNRLSGQLSLGSRRQAALAIALMGPPKFLLLDEPAASLDPDEVVRLRRFLNHLPKDRVVLISSHAIGEAAKVTSRALILKGGQLVATPFWAELGPDLEAGYLSLVGEHAKV
jgi:ABC-type multidrug transport system ATPase subunit